MMTDEEIEALARAMIVCTLPKEAWTHAAHFAAALWMLRTRGEAATRAQMPDMIRRYNESVGGRNTETEGYRETITQASLTMASQALAAAKEAPLSEVLATLLAGPCGQSGWVFAHWTKDRLFSPEARRAWAPPDVAPLPAG
jgi:hypothetical protein